MKTVKYYVATLNDKKEITHIWSAHRRLDNARFDAAFFKTAIIKADPKGWPTNTVVENKYA